MLAQEIEDQPHQRTAFEIARSVLDMARHDPLKLNAGPQNADRGLDMR
jgi:hypothetical protein